MEADSEVCFCVTGEISWFCHLSITYFRVFSSDAAILAYINPCTIPLPFVFQEDAFCVSEIVHLSSVTSIFK